MGGSLLGLLARTHERDVVAVVIIVPDSDHTLRITLANSPETEQLLHSPNSSAGPLSWEGC